MILKNLIFILLLISFNAFGLGSNRVIESTNEIELSPSTKTISNKDINIISGFGVKLEDASGDYVNLSAPSNVTGNYTFYFPDADGSPDALLQTNGSGQTGFVSSIPRSILEPGNAFSILFNDASGDASEDSNFTWNNLTSQMTILGELLIDNLSFNGNTIASTNTNGDITLTPDGDGVVNVTKRFKVTSTTNSSQPCPTMTEAQRDLLSPVVSGDCVFNTTTNKLNTYNGSVWEETGSSSSVSGTLDTFYSENFESTILAADFTCGNDASFDNGGSFVGTLEDDTSDPLNQTTSLKYTQASGSLNDWCKSPVVSTYNKQRGHFVGMVLNYTHDGDGTQDIQVVLYDDSSDTAIEPDTYYFDTKSKSTRLAVSFFIPNTAGDLAYGFHVKTENIGKVLKIDDVEFTTNPFLYKELLDSSETSMTQGGSSLTDRSDEIEWDLGTATITDNGSTCISREDDSSNTRTKFVATRDNCLVDIVFSGNTTGSQATAQIFVNGSLKINGQPSQSSGQRSLSVGEVLLQNGEYFSVSITGDSINNTASNVFLTYTTKSMINNVISPLQNISKVRYDWSGGSSSTSVATSTNQKIDFDSKVFDDDGLVTGAGSSSWIYTVPRKGKYRVKARLQLSGAISDWDTGEDIALELWNNGSMLGDVLYFKRQSIDAVGSGNHVEEMQASRIIDVEKGDLIHIVGRHTTGIPLNIDSGFVEIEKTDQNAELGAFPTNRYGYKLLTADVTSDTTVSDWTSTVVIGETYEVFMQACFTLAAGDFAAVSINHNGNVEGRVSFTQDTSGSGAFCSGTTAKFLATSTSVTFTTSSIGGGSSLDGNSTKGESYIRIERKNATETSEF